MELISVIVPIYNVEKYLERCVNSLLNQRYRNIEVLLVDDGSTDKSGEICDSFQQVDTRVKVFHKKNGGVSDTRNFGIEKATGEYLAFVDSDDYVSSDYLGSLYTMLTQKNADIAMCSYQKTKSSKIEYNDNITAYDTALISNEETLEKMLYRKGIDSYCWGKLYRKTLFDEIRFPVGELFEDVKIMYKVYDKANRIVFNQAKLYFYYQRSGSIVNSEFSIRKMDQVLASEEVLEFISRKYPELTDAAASKLFIAAVDIFRRIPGKGAYKKEKLYLKSIIKKYRTNVWRDNKNKRFTRLIALASFINIEWFSLGGRVFQFLKDKKIIRLKNPV
ncbi:glycosyltransferase family 2 protein [Parablautia sp. Marseille-Q6255]|uniref:glycosyltransferase family 2 protein n=1 Tax=Parablautia sp. Marseille-Q6255 TaxID=3039593 RepID=UPI0024BC7752|nr:glycosyltransferase [Parablautia sp. Marseille-Q6255]